MSVRGFPPKYLFFDPGSPQTCSLGLGSWWEFSLFKYAKKRFASHVQIASWRTNGKRMRVKGMGWDRLGPHLHLDLCQGCAIIFVHCGLSYKDDGVSLAQSQAQVWRLITCSPHPILFALIQSRSLLGNGPDPTTPQKVMENGWGGPKEPPCHHYDFLVRLLEQT